MTERRTINDVIQRGPSNNFTQNRYLDNSQMSFHPNANSQLNNDDDYGNQFYDQRPIRQIQEQNRNLKEMIKKIQQKNREYVGQPKEVRQNTSNLDRRIDHNNKKIQELRDIVSEQRDTIETYRNQLQQFQRNLQGIMKLDKDIHSKLVNPHTSSTLQKNVRNVLVALNSRAPYDKVMKMIENIRV